MQSVPILTVDSSEQEHVKSAFTCIPGVNPSGNRLVGGTARVSPSIYMLMQANKEMQEQMKMLMAMVRDKPNKDALKTPPPKRKAVSTPEPASDASGTEDLSEQDNDAPTEQAKRHRLCERKPSKKIQVPQEIHEQWAAGGQGREDLMQMLEEAEFNKALCLHPDS